MQNHAGLLVVFEGIDGSGKSTALRAVEKLLTASNYQLLATQEPGGTKLGITIRSLVQCANQRLTPQAEFLLFAADRAEHRAHVIEPALAAGTIVLCDRMADSSVAYQGYGRGLSLDHIHAVNAWALNGILADLTCYFEIDYATAQIRLQHRAKLSSFDQERAVFFDRVIAGYEALYHNRTDVIRLCKKDSIACNAQRIYNQIMVLINSKKNVTMHVQEQVQKHV